MNEVKIEPKKIPNVEMKIACKTLFQCLERAMADPQKRADFEAWKAQREGKGS